MYAQMLSKFEDVFVKKILTMKRNFTIHGYEIDTEDNKLTKKQMKQTY